jgi:hypothetical protein
MEDWYIYIDGGKYYIITYGRNGAWCEDGPYLTEEAAHMAVLAARPTS